MTSATLPAELPPLAKDQDGVLRVRGTRIPLERIVFEWNAGASPEGIVESFPVLELADVYGAIAYYLQHRSEGGSGAAPPSTSFVYARSAIRRQPTPRLLEWCAYLLHRARVLQPNP